jgi:hypothetical protein
MIAVSAIQVIKAGPYHGFPTQIRRAPPADCTMAENTWIRIPKRPTAGSRVMRWNQRSGEPTAPNQPGPRVELHQISALI